MPIKYFQSSWNDIKHSKGWFGRLCLLALVNFIPIFGQIVSLGYLYGWAREMAWGSRQPMPEHIIDNRDGKFWRRGGFAFIVALVFGLVSAIVAGVGQAMMGSGPAGMANGHYVGSVPAGGAMLVAGFTVYFIGLLLGLFLQMFVWIACMRLSIYDRLSAGFQFGKIWKMFRHDTLGIFKILGMNLLVGVLLSLVFMLAYAVLLLMGAMLFSIAGYGLDAAPRSSVMPLLFGSLGIVGVLVVLVFVFFAMVAGAFVEALTTRAMGYWTAQFDVAHWRGQDEPMPFELVASQVPPAGYYGTDQWQSGQSAQQPAWQPDQSTQQEQRSEWYAQQHAQQPEGQWRSVQPEEQPLQQPDWQAPQMHEPAQEPDREIGEPSRQMSEQPAQTEGLDSLSGQTVRLEEPEWEGSLRSESPEPASSDASLAEGQMPGK